MERYSQVQRRSNLFLILIFQDTDNLANGSLSSSISGQPKNCFSTLSKFQVSLDAPAAVCQLQEMSKLLPWFLIAIQGYYPCKVRITDTASPLLFKRRTGPVEVDIITMKLSSTNTEHLSISKHSMRSWPKHCNTTRWSFWKIMSHAAIGEHRFLTHSTDLRDVILDAPCFNETATGHNQDASMPLFL